MKNHLPFLGLIACLAASLGACGDEEPEEQCEALFRALCQRLSDCAGRDFDQCFDANVNSPPPCSAAVGVSDSYDACLEDIEAASCDVVAANPNSPPPSCSGTILFPEGSLTGGGGGSGGCGGPSGGGGSGGGG